MSFDIKRLENAMSIVDRFVYDGRIPGAVACIGKSNGIHTIRAFGYSRLFPKPSAMADNTLFDAASITKVVCTTILTLLFMEYGILRLDDAVGTFIPEFTAGKEIAIRHLLTHTSGLPAWIALFAPGRDRSAMISGLFATPLKSRPGTTVEYSCLGYILLGEILERISGKGLDALAREMIFDPLGMSESSYNPSPELALRAAATEQDRDSGVYLQGIVHDENARGLGGVSGNAGLFTTAGDLSIFCRMLLNMGRHSNERFLSEASVRLSTSDHTSELGETRGLGWVIKGRDRYSSAGDLFSETSFGHTGFTGTSIWIDPKADLFVILLTNAVHPTRENKGHIIRLRPLFHNAVASAVTG